MADESVLFDGVVFTDYGQFDLVWKPGGGFDGEFERFFAGQANGLVGAADPLGVYVNLARRSGGSEVRIVLLDAAPPLLDAGFEDVVEVSTVVPVDASPIWVSWGEMTSGDMSGLSPGTYRLRVSARGRDAGEDGEYVEGVVDWYLLEFWPAEWAEDEIVRAGSTSADYWHQENGGNR